MTSITRIRSGVGRSVLAAIGAAALLGAAGQARADHTHRGLDRGGVRISTVRGAGYCLDTLVEAVR